MNGSTGKTSSCLAITEKRPHRPGGCVGIFFQLFDWNRRFAKKKLFSKTLLPPARAKQSSKKFGGDEKMPKTKSHLIANENSRGFPNAKKMGNLSDLTEQKNEMRAAGLVARLMGLESLPAVHRERQKKISKTPPCDAREENFINSHSGSDMQVVNLEKGSSKNESRPQKLQKTGQFERRAVTRFGAEALQIKNVLSRGRKHNHPKLASPVKSPRISTSRNVSRASRLIDAATRILEPGLHATSRAKCALTYSSSRNYVPKDKVLIDGMGLEVMSPDILEQPNNMGVDKSLMGQTSCKNCGNLLDVVDTRPNAEDQPFLHHSSATNFANKSLQGSERIKPRQLNSYPQQEKDASYQRNQAQSAGGLDNTRACSELISDRKPVYSESQLPQQLKNQQCRPQKDEPSCGAFRQRTGNEMLVAKGRTPARAKLNNLQSRRASSAANAVTGAKDFVALNRNLSGRSRPRVSNKAENYMVDTERNFCSRRDDSLSKLRTPVRKRRTANVNAQLGGSGLVNSTSIRQKNVKCDSACGKELEHNTPTSEGASIKIRSAIQGEAHRTNGNHNDDVVSFTFSSPLRSKKSVPSGLKDIRDHTDKNVSYQRKLPFDGNDGQTFLQRQSPLRGDTLGAFLEQKLKELTSQEEDELTNGGAVTKRSTAMILQELISALTSRKPFSPDGHMFNAQTTFQTEGRVGGTSVGLSHDGDHLSPGSVLEAPFSNDSCFSSSLDDISGHRLLSDSMDYSCDPLQPIETDTDLLDSATSTTGCTGTIVTDLLNHVSRTLLSIDLAVGGLTGSRLTYVKEVILNAELLFGSGAQRNSNGMKCFLRDPILIDEIETLAGAKWTNFNRLGFEDCKEGRKDSQVKKFVFDSMIEWLDSKYSRYCNTGFKAWRRVPLCMNTEMVIEEVGKEVTSWTNFGVMIPDEIIKWEMSHSLGKWTDFEIEAFEIGAQIDCDILEVLVDELVMDF